MKTETLIAVFAHDWAHYEQQLSRTTEFKLITGWVAGFLISEDAETLVIAHQMFHEGSEVRYTSVIQKREILHQIRFQLAHIYDLKEGTHEPQPTVYHPE